MLATSISFNASAQTSFPDLETSFRNPPDSARPWVNWFWMDGNIAKEGIKADLTAMAQAGIGGALLMDVSQNIPPGPIHFGTPEWFDLLNFTTTEAARLGLDISLNNDPGWSGSGGPWITPDLAMQQLVWSRTNVSGPAKYDGPLPFIAPVKGYSREIATLAFPALVGDGAPMPGFNPKMSASFRLDDGGKALIDNNTNTGISVPAPRKGKSHLQFEFAEPFIARRLSLTTGVTNQFISGELRVSDDGRSFRKVRDFVIQRPVLTLEFEQVSARFFRVQFNETPSAQLPFSIFEVELIPLYRIEMAQIKSGLGRAPLRVSQLTNLPPYAIIRPETILDLTDKTDASGRLVWDVPPGPWTIIRFAHVPTGMENHPPNPGGLGLECDKLSKAAIERHFESFLAKTHGLAGTHIDSWEIGYQNWTPDFLSEFRKRRGYDPLHFLPAYSGRIVESPEISERFFWDIRRTVADLLADNYAGRLAELARQHGMNLSIEAYASTANGPFDQLQYASRADTPMAEFWTGVTGAGLWHNARVMASAAHTSGRPVVAAEAFTSQPANGSWINHPFSLKPLADAAFCEGINRLVFHCFAHQPWTNLAPGMTMGPFGVHYDRNETWWDKSKPWHEYLARCQYMLRIGSFAADVCYLPPEGAYTDPPTPELLEPPLPEGYNYDFASPEALQHMSVKDGRITLPDGMNYRVLVLPPTDQVTPSLLRKIKELADAGATVIGPRPVKSPSLMEYPQCDEQVRELAGALWDPSGISGSKTNAPKILDSKSLKRVLASLNVPPDFEPLAPLAGCPLRWIHRTAPGAEIYFIANSNAKPVTVECAFRVKGLLPEIWSPDSGEIQRFARWTEREGRTALTLDLDSHASAFVLFRKNSTSVDRVATVARDGKRDTQAQAWFDPEGHIELTTFEPGHYSVITASGKTMEWSVTNLPPETSIDGPWNVEFNSRRVAIDRLESWADRKEPEIKYFSGTARYSRKFVTPEITPAQSRRVFLDLGKVNVIASIKLNGTDLGTIWKPPFRIEVTKAIKGGTNDLEVEVVNLWPNRLIGDEQLPEDCDWIDSNGGGSGLLKWPDWLKTSSTPRPSRRQTFATWKYWGKDSPLLESGLLGPVKLVFGERHSE